MLPLLITLYRGSKQNYQFLTQVSKFKILPRLSGSLQLVKSTKRLRLSINYTLILLPLKKFRQRAKSVC